MTDPNVNEDSSTPNPYASQPPVSLDASSVILRPTGVTVIGVMSILGGIMGMLSGLMQFSQQLMQGLATSFIPMGEAGDAQREWFAEIQDINAKYMIPNFGLAFLGIIVSVCLLVGGFAVLAPKKWSADWIRKTLLAAIVVATLSLIFYIAMQTEMQPVMARQFDVMAEANGGNNPFGSSDTIKSMQTIMMFVGYGFALMWFLTKLTLYIVGRRYLNRDTVKEYIEKASVS